MLWGLFVGGGECTGWIAAPFLRLSSYLHRQYRMTDIGAHDGPASSTATSSWYTRISVLPWKPHSVSTGPRLRLWPTQPMRPRPRQPPMRRWALHRRSRSPAQPCQGRSPLPQQLQHGARLRRTRSRQGTTRLLRTRQALPQRRRGERSRLRRTREAPGLAPGLGQLEQATIPLRATALRERTRKRSREHRTNIDEEENPSLNESIE